MHIPLLSRKDPGVDPPAATSAREQPPDDPLALFEAEEAAETAPATRQTSNTPDVGLPPAAQPPPASLPVRPSLALDTILARRTPVLWPEAVAVILAACDRLAPADAPEGLAPELPGLRIQADGTVDVREGTAGESSVVRLARTLHALLPTQSTPAPLRLLITKWIGATGAHTIREFAAELTYFARPDGDALIRALYERCMAAAGADAPAAPAQPPLRDPARPPRQARRKSPPRWLFPAAAAAAALAASVVWYSTQAPAAVLDEALSSISASAETSDTALTTADAAGTAGLGRLTDAGRQEAPVAGAGRSSDIRLPAPRSRVAGTAPAEPPASGASASAAALLSLPAGQPAPASAPTAASGPILTPVPSFLPPPARRAGEAAIVSGSSRIYSSVDADVEPPKLVYPQLALPPERPSPDTAINTMEVVVGEDGRVQTVQLVSTPQRMNDMMLLSAAKVWRFEPASRDGAPVRYRMRVSWATTP